MKFGTPFVFLLLSVFAQQAVFAQKYPEPYDPNPSLADSVFPIPHGNSLQSNSVGTQGPDPNTQNTNIVYHGNLDGRDWKYNKIDKMELLAGGTTILKPAWKVRMSKRNLDPIALLYSSSGDWFWASTFTDIIKVKTLPNKGVELVSKIPRKDWDVDLANGDTFHGAYGLVFRDDSYLVPSSKAILRYVSESGANTPIRFSNSYTLSSISGITGDDKIRGLNLFDDGFLVFVTEGGAVGVIDTTNIDNMVAAAPALQLSAEGKNHEVSNSLAVTPDGGIFIVSDSHMFRAQWNSGTRTLTQEWATEYDSSSTLIPGRLGIGSGTTPSILKSSVDQKYYVSIGDGAELMKITTFSCETGNIVGKAEVKFGVNSKTFSTTENSLTSYNDRIFVTNNDYQAQNDNYAFESVIEGVAPMGVEQFKFDPSTSSTDPYANLVNSWTRPDISYPNGIPVVSTSSDTVYDTARFELTYTEWDNICSSYYSCLPTGTRSEQSRKNHEIRLCTIYGWNALKRGVQAQNNDLRRFGPMLANFFTGGNRRKLQSMDAMSEDTTDMIMRGSNKDLKGFEMDKDPKDKYRVNKSKLEKKYNRNKLAPPSQKIWVWAVIGLDWDTGVTNFSQITGTGLFYNSFYAGTCIGPDQSILSGTILGFYKVLNQKIDIDERYSYRDTIFQR